MTDRNELNDYLFGELDPDRRMRLEVRIERDPELSARLDELRH